MSTKQEIFDMIQSYKSRKCFQPRDFTGKTTDNARDFISTFKNYCKLNNIDDADALLSLNCASVELQNVGLMVYQRKLRKTLSL